MTQHISQLPSHHLYHIYGLPRGRTPRHGIVFPSVSVLYHVDFPFYMKARRVSIQFKIYHQSRSINHDILHISFDNSNNREPRSNTKNVTPRLN